MAVICGLDAVKFPDQHITVYSDSQYVIMGARREWKIKTNHKWWAKLREVEKKHTTIIYNWIPRELNKEADAAVSKVMRDITNG